MLRLRLAAFIPGDRHESPRDLASPSPCWRPLAVESALAGAVVDQFRGGAFGVAWNAARCRCRGEVSGRSLGPGRAGSPALLRSDPADAAQAAAAAQDARDLLPDGRRRYARQCDRAACADAACAARGRQPQPDDCSAISTPSSATRAAVQSRYTYMLWTRDRPYLVQVGSTNDVDGRPNEVTLHRRRRRRIAHRRRGLGFAPARWRRTVT